PPRGGFSPPPPPPRGPPSRCAARGGVGGAPRRRAIRLLTQIELTLKQDYGQRIWPQLETLSLLLCHRHFPASFASV
ncbi:MAG TPA: hypothetical protein DCM44_04270, partial [Pantoea sp.]|nr:hypothetical protein [Pantoea sp.]